MNREKSTKIAYINLIVSKLFVSSYSMTITICNQEAQTKVSNNLEINNHMDEVHFITIRDKYRYS